MWRAALLFSAMLTGGPFGSTPAEEALPAYETAGPAQMEVTATAYTSGPESTGKRPGHPAYGLTATGTRAEQGQTVAVDPRVIPLGSRVCVAELEQCLIAEDTGGAVRGRHIDLYMERVDDALRWGRRRVQVQVFPKV